MIYIVKGKEMIGMKMQMYTKTLSAMAVDGMIYDYIEFLNSAYPVPVTLDDVERVIIPERGIAYVYYIDGCVDKLLFTSKYEITEKIRVEI